MGMTVAESEYLALSCRAGGADQCPKLKVERTQRGHAAMAESDPLRKSGEPKCCDAQHGFFNGVVGCDPRLEGST